MQAIILLGGQGTRLQGLYPDRPKALVPVAGQPFLAHQLAWLARHGIDDVHLAAGYKSQAIHDWVAAHPSRSKITISGEPAPLGTGGALKYAEPFIRTDPFLVLNGDSLMPNLDCQAFMRIGQTSGTLGTLAITRIASTGRYGTVEFDERQRITAFREKAAHTGGWINGGVYLARRSLLNALKPGETVSLETDLFPAMCAAGQLDAFLAAPPLLDMGTPDGIQTMEAYIKKANGL